MKISKTSLKKSRIHSSYVDRNTYVNKANKVEAISPIKNIQNSSFHSSENHLVSYDAYYDNLKELKKEYRRFYKEEQSLEKAIKNFKDDKNKVIKNIKELISKYNLAIQSLSDFDRVFKMDNVSNIIEILNSFSGSLNSIGITIRDILLEVDEEILRNSIKETPYSLDFLFSKNGLLPNLYSAFRNVKLPKKESLEKRFEKKEYKGIILDNKT